MKPNLGIALIFILSIIIFNMSAFNLNKSMEKAAKRFGLEKNNSKRHRRSDKGRPRLAAPVIDCINQILGSQERAPINELLEALAQICTQKGFKPPSRATLYKVMNTLTGLTLRKKDLPQPVQDALYNLAPESEVPAHQVAFYCFNYGDLNAVSYAAGLPWLAIYQALKMSGYRKKSKGLIQAVAIARGI